MDFQELKIKIKYIYLLFQEIENNNYNYSLNKLNKLYEPNLKANYICLIIKCKGGLKIKYKINKNENEEILIEKNDTIIELYIYTENIII